MLAVTCYCYFEIINVCDGEIINVNCCCGMCIRDGGVNGFVQM